MKGVRRARTVSRSNASCEASRKVCAVLLCSQTQLVKDMEAKLEEQEQHRAYLDQLLPILKQRDPSLLNLMNSSLVSK